MLPSMILFTTRNTSAVNSELLTTPPAALSDDTMGSKRGRQKSIRKCAEDLDRSHYHSSGEKKELHFEKIRGGTDTGQYVHEEDRVDRISRCDISYERKVV
jgi:hypothetical protein